ncbi:MAG: sialate O-acetylesterase [Kiritimatiellia bacterium]
MNTARCIGNLMLTSMFVVGLAMGREPDPRAKEIPPYDGREPDMSKPVQVFILMGQSNMLGFGKTLGNEEKTLENAVKQQGLYPYLVDADGNWITRKDVRNVRVMNFKDHKNQWMTIDSANIGPEIGIGWHLGNIIDAPVLILKSCIGNRSLGWDLLPPGTPSFDGEPGYRGTPQNPEMAEEKPAAGWYAGKQYDDDIGSAKQVLENLDKYVPGAKDYEVVGFFWWQGDKDMRNNTHSKHYEANLVRLIEALRKDFNNPNAKFVAATLGQTSLTTGGGQGLIRDAKFALEDPQKHPELKGHYAAVFANPLSKGGSSSGHYNGHAQTYMNVGEAMGWAMAQLLQGGGGASAARLGSSSRPAAAAPGAPRRISPENFGRLQHGLQQALSGLSRTGKLEEIPLSVSLNPSVRVWLKAATAEGTLTFGMVGSTQTTDVPWSSMSPEDQFLLARLAAQLAPDNGDVLGIAAVYTEILGDARQAPEMFGRAGQSRAHWEALLK